MAIINDVLGNFLLPLNAHVFFDLLQFIWSLLPSMVSGLLFLSFFIFLVLGVMRMVH